MNLVWIVVTAALLTSQSESAQKGADVFPSEKISSQFAVLAEQAKGLGTSGAKLGDYQSHNVGLSLRTSSGGAEVHAHYDDIFVVRQGKATLTTGGTVIDAKTDSDGETRGSGIANGKSQPIAAGDVVHIPAGTPHQLTIAKGVVYNAIVVKVKEP